MEDNLEERLKSLKGIKCDSCLDTNFVNEFVDGDWQLKYEKTGTIDENGNEGIRLIKCNHHADLGY